MTFKVIRGQSQGHVRLKVSKGRFSTIINVKFHLVHANYINFDDKYKSLVVISNFENLQVV